MLKFDEALRDIKGDFAIKVFKAGKLIDEFADHNLIVNSGRVRLAELASGKSNKFITQIGVGTGRAEEAEDDESLENQVLFDLTSSSTDGRDAIFNFVIKPEDANGLRITEFALFCADDVMFSHRVRRSSSGEVRAIEKENDIQIEGCWVIHF